MNSQFSFGLAVLPACVTKRDIADGVSRDCYSCAISIALNRTLPRLGFNCCFVKLSPYAVFADPDGLVIFRDYPCVEVGRIAVEHLPDGLLEWAMEFDDWSEFHEYGSVKEWRLDTGKKSRDYPPPRRPEPISFVFDWGKLKLSACNNC
jgi:hypothetical protein